MLRLKGGYFLPLGTPEEMVCSGGELAFVSQMVKDSIQLQGRVHWYTSMVGKKATLKQLRRMLHDSKVTALRTTEFVQVRQKGAQHFYFVGVAVFIANLLLQSFYPIRYCSLCSHFCTAVLMAKLVRQS